MKKLSIIITIFLSVGLVICGKVKASTVEYAPLSSYSNYIQDRNYIHFYFDYTGVPYTCYVYPCSNDIREINEWLFVYDNNNHIDAITESAYPDWFSFIATKGTTQASFNDRSMAIYRYVCTSSSCGWEQVYTSFNNNINLTYNNINFTKQATNTSEKNAFTIIDSNVEIYDYTRNEVLFEIPTNLPAFLDNYTCTVLQPGERNFMISGISSGVIYFDKHTFDNYNSGLVYYDLELQSQPYTAKIDDYIVSSTGEWVGQYFDLSSYTGADLIFYEKYGYLEGYDNITSTVCVPSVAFTDLQTGETNENGSVIINFDYKDSNGDIIPFSITNYFNTTNPFFNDLFNSYGNNTFGLTSIITAPLSLITSLDSSTCSALSLPLPFINSNLTLPCMYSIYEDTFGSAFTLYQTITFGLVSYWVLIRIFNLVKDFKNPDHDEIEVMDL